MRSHIWFSVRLIFPILNLRLNPSPDSYHGCGIDEGLQILSDVRDEFGIPVTSDFSDSRWAKQTGEVCDLVQVPAYLCRQTSILRAAAETGRPIHLKKGQFMSPWNMANSVKKIEAAGGNQILLARVRVLGLLCLALY